MSDEYLIDEIGDRLDSCVCDSSRAPLISQGLVVVLGMLVLMVGYVVVSELRVYLSRFCVELCLWVCKHQPVHFLLELSVLVEQKCCNAKHDTQRDSYGDCNTVAMDSS